MPQTQGCQRVQLIHNERIKSNLIHELKHFLPEDDVQEVARHIGVQIDGIWVRAGLLPQIIDTSTAISEMEFTISQMLPYDEVSAARHKEARKKIETVADIALGSKIFKEKFLRV